MIPTAEQVRKVKEETKWGHRKLARHFGIHANTARALVDDKYAEWRREWHRKRSAQRRAETKEFATDYLNLGLGNGPRPTADILKLRDQRLSARPRDLTAYILGDPLPGESALDRRMRA